jgi:hypothetical protein
MDPVTITLPQDDTLSYKVYVAKAVPRGDVAITVNLQMVASTSDNDINTINARLKNVLLDFIGADWRFVGHTREGPAPGYEKIAVQAIAKVSAEENRNLEERARKASRDGIEFGGVAVKRTLPQDHVNQIVKELWFDAVRKVQEHLREFEQASGRRWRIGDIVFGVPDGGRQNRPYVKGGYREDATESLADLVESGLSGAEKISLIAEVTLKSARPQ